MTCHTPSSSPYTQAEGKSVRGHPVIDQLLELRAVLEKLRPLDAKLKHQIDRLLNFAEQASAGGNRGTEEDPLSYRPNPEALLAHEEDVEGEGEEGRGKVAAYRPPRLMAVPYEEEGRQQTRDGAKARQHLAKLRQSEILQTLQEQFGERPEVVEGVGTKASRKVDEDEEERRR